MRNATLMAIAPTASIGLVAGTTPGIDPQFSQLFSRATSAGKFLEVNRNLVAALSERGLWDEVKEDLLRAQGDLSKIAAVPRDLKEIYRTSFQLSPYAYLNVAGRAQKWIDQAISRNIYLASRDVGEMVDLYTTAWRMGVKTTYYLHMLPRHSAEQSTVKINKAEQLRGTDAGNGSSGAGRRGFGFARSSGSPSAPSPQSAPPTAPAAPATAGPTLSAPQLITLTGEPVDEVDACPTDPQERLQCDSCQ
jgi:ribonucleoside-diphosphate reductase alpha chain